MENFAKHYGIHLISEPDFTQILSHVEDFVSEWYSKNDSSGQKSSTDSFESLVSNLKTKTGGKK
jgi:hypothetical protein